MMLSFLKKDNKTIDNKEHIKSVVESLGQFKGKTYQIAFRKDLSDYWIGPNRKNLNGEFKTSITKNIDSAISELNKYENTKKNN